MRQLGQHRQIKIRIQVLVVFFVCCMFRKALAVSFVSPYPIAKKKSCLIQLGQLRQL